MGRTGTARSTRPEAEDRAVGLRVVPAEAARGERGPGRRTAGLLKALAREPLVHFLLIGALLLAGNLAWRDANDRRAIVVTPERVESLAARYALQFGERPAPDVLEQVVDAYLEEEVLYREGRALGLDRDDEIVRRRIAQKTQFLLQDRAAPAEPAEAELQAFYAGQPERYAQPPRTSFSHLYFSPDRDGDVASRARADRALAALVSGAAVDRADADPFPDRNAYAAMSREEAARLFGDGELARALDQAPAGSWSGPYRSGYGWHLLFIDGRAPGGRAPFSAVADQVRGDLLAERQAAANARALAELRSRYAVVRRDREAGR